MDTLLANGIEEKPHLLTGREVPGRAIIWTANQLGHPSSGSRGDPVSLLLFHDWSQLRVESRQLALNLTR